MAITNPTLPNGRSTFMLKRPLITHNGFTSDIDPTIKEQLLELDSILGKHVFHRVEDMDVSYYDSAETKATDTKKAAKKPIAPATGSSAYPLNLIEELKRPIIAKKTDITEIWDKEGLLFHILDFSKKHKSEYSSISDCIDQDKELANLKYEYQHYLTQNWTLLTNDQKYIYSFVYITDYLLAYAYWIKGISEVNSLHNFILNRKDGLLAITNYALVSASRRIIQKESLNIDDVEIDEKPYTYNDDIHPLIQKILGAHLSLNQSSFSKELHKILNDFIYNNYESNLIASAKIGHIPAEYIPLLIKYIKNSPVPINKANVNYFLPLYINAIKSSTSFKDPEDSIFDAEFDKDFEVEFFEDDQSTVQANVDNVQCAAKLFYSMVVGEELDVFNLINYFTHNVLIKDRIDIQDPKLRENIQLYVFSNKFKDVKTGRILDRTRPAEQQMFYRLVFGAGNAKVTNDMIINSDFNRLWKVLILEADNYIEKAQASPNPDSYVSRQNVMQAVEEIQYNLSANCTGMATVISPMIYAELNFIVHKIFEHPEIVKQIVPANGTWWRVIETLYARMKQKRLNATVVYNKAKLSYSILSKIANYNPASFEQDATFSAFISDINALISTQSIIQENYKKEQYGNRNEEPAEADGEENEKSYKTAETVETGNDEWDF